MNRSAHYICTLGLLVLTGFFLSSCTQSGNSSSTLSNTQSSNLTIDSTSIIPVLDGKPTTTGVYIHNNTNHDITDIHYGVVNKKSSSLVINSNSCTLVKANSTCLLKFTTPNLKPLDSGSDLITANYNNEQSSQLINYQYVDSSKYSGVTFGGSSIDLIGMRDYATVYAFVGKSATASNVGFDVSNNSVGIVNGLTGSKIDIGSNEVVALELMTNQNITANHVTITPTTSSSQTSIQNLNSNILNVAIIPTNNANLIMSNVPVLNSSNQTATVTVYNNGKSAATNLNLTSSNPSIVSVSGANGSCLTTPSLNPDSSCDYEISLANLSSNGSVLLSLTSSANTKTNTVYYTGSQTVPMISLVPSSNELVESLNTTKALVFDVVNHSGIGLTNINFTLINRLVNTNVSITNNTCGSTITTPCQLTVDVVAGALVDEGMFYILMTGGANGEDYSFVSTPVNTTVLDFLPELVSIVPNNNAVEVSLATGLTLNFSESMAALTLNTSNIKLLRESDNIEVGLISQGVSNNNQTVAFTQSNGTLTPYTMYKVVINPNAIKDSTGNSIDSNITESVVAVFRTVYVDVISPTIINTVPISGLGGLSRTPNVSIQFSESMAVNTLTTQNIQLKTNGGVSFTGYTLNYNPANYTVSLLWTGAGLASETTYQLIVNESQITDIAGNKLGNNGSKVQTTFTIGDYTAPVISNTVPANGARGISESTTISITFSESMNIYSLNRDNIKLFKVIGNVPITLNNPVFGLDNRQVTFSLASDLEMATDYNIVLNATQIFDISGNRLGDNPNLTTATFTTSGYGLVYVIPTSRNGNLGNFAGANGACQTAGNSLPISGATWKALLFENSVVENNLKYYRYDVAAPSYKGAYIGLGAALQPSTGIPIVPLESAISLTITGSYWYGATNSNNMLMKGGQCTTWTSNSFMSFGNTASLNSTQPYGISVIGNSGCNSVMYLVCIYNKQ